MITTIGSDKNSSAAFAAIMGAGGRNRGEAAADLCCAVAGLDPLEVGESICNLRQIYGAFLSLLHLTTVYLLLLVHRIQPRGLISQNRPLIWPGLLSVRAISLLPYEHPP